MFAEGIRRFNRRSIRGSWLLGRERRRLKNDLSRRGLQLVNKHGTRYVNGAAHQEPGGG
jgi:hypothetical protein